MKKIFINCSTEEMNHDLSLSYFISTCWQNYLQNTRDLLLVIPKNEKLDKLKCKMLYVKHLGIPHWMKHVNGLLISGHIYILIRSRISNSFFSMEDYLNDVNNE